MSDAETKSGWRPTKPSHDYTDEELKATPIWDRVRKECTYKVGDVDRFLPESMLLMLVRGCIKDIWEALNPDYKIKTVTD